MFLKLIVFFFSLASFFTFSVSFAATSKGSKQQWVGRAIKNRQPAQSSKTTASPLNQVKVKAAKIPPRTSRDKKVAIGIVRGGALGTLGGLLEFALLDRAGLSIGFGGSEAHESFVLQGKQYLTGDQFRPYLAAGYARWSGKGEVITSTSDNFLAGDFLSEPERASGEFTKNVFFPTLGFQYRQKSGPLAGAAVYAEATMLIDVEAIDGQGTGALGLMYYF